MRSLRKLNAAAGTSYTRWAQVVNNLKFVAMILSHGHQPDCDILKDAVRIERNDRGALTKHAIIRNCDCKETE